jgi:hypothetical protein
MTGMTHSHGSAASGSGAYRQWFPAPYEEMRRSFSWQVPGRYNIAADVLDKHDRHAWRCSGRTGKGTSAG